MDRQDWHQEALEQLSEKQLEEMDQMLARRYGLPIPTHTEDEVRQATFSELLSGLPLEGEKE